MQCCSETQGSENDALVTGIVVFVCYDMPLSCYLTADILVYIATCVHCVLCTVPCVAC